MRSFICLNRIVAPLVIALFPLAGSRAESDSPLAEIIDRVREYEQLLADIDYTVRYSYTDFLAEEGPPMAVSTHTKTQHVVAQGAWFRVDTENSRTLIDKQTREDESTWAFDGTTSRIAQNRRLANEVAGPWSGQRFLRPHRICGIPDTTIPNVPLSTILAGDAAVREACADLDPATDMLEPDRRTIIEYAGRERLGELECSRVTLKIMLESRDLCIYRAELWLAEERGDFVCRLVAYSSRLSQDRRHAVYEVEEWQQIGEGIWMPARIKHTVYSWFDVANGVEPPRIAQEHLYEIDVATLNPTYEVAYFQELPLDKGAAVYKVVDNQIESSFRVGAPAAPAAPPPTRGPWRWIIGGHLAVAAVLVAMIAMSRLRRRVVPAGTARNEPAAGPPDATGVHKS